MVLSGIRPSFPSLSRSTGQITHVLLTRSPLEHPHQKMMRAFPFDLHVLSTPPAFVLSQDQTLQKNKQKNYNRQKTKKPTKQKQTNTKNHSVPAFMFMYKQSLLHQMTHYRVLKQHHHLKPNTTKQSAGAVNSDHTNIQTPPQNHKPPRHNNKNRDGSHAIPVTLLDFCPCEGFLASPQH